MPISCLNKRSKTVTTQLTEMIIGTAPALLCIVCFTFTYVRITNALPIALQQ